MIRSHSRYSFPFDKRLPKRIHPYKLLCFYEFGDYNGLSSTQKQAMKRMHIKKQREHDRKVNNDD